MGETGILVSLGGLNEGTTIDEETIVVNVSFEVFLTGEKMGYSG